MNDFVKHSFSKENLKKFFVASTLGNFIGFLAGSIVTTLFTYRVYERKGLKNLFGVLPRDTVVVHMLPGWLEWLLATLLGFIVMELVSYYTNLILLNKKRQQAAAGRQEER